MFLTLAVRRGILCDVNSDRTPSAGKAYLVRPGEAGEGVGPAVVVVHSWWGMNRFIKDTCDRLADLGFVAVAPDLFGGVVPDSGEAAEALLEAMDPNVAAGLLISTVAAARSASDNPDGPIAVIGYSMGASWALWLATRQPQSVSKVVAFYGTQVTDFSEMQARLCGHFADDDEIVNDDEVVLMCAELFEAGHEPEVWHYRDVGHFFAEPSAPAFDEAAADLAWLRTVAFLNAD